MRADKVGDREVATEDDTRRRDLRPAGSEAPFGCHGAGVTIARVPFEACV